MTDHQSSIYTFLGLAHILRLVADENGDDGKPLVGEASISLATACYGDSINGNNGHTPNDVLYIAFPGSVADTVEKLANWSAESFDEFEPSILGLGNELIEVFS